MPSAFTATITWVKCCGRTAALSCSILRASRRGLWLPGGAGDTVRKLLQVVLENHRLAALPAIAEQFHRLKDQAQQRAEVVITSAFAIDQGQLDELLPALERRFARKLYARVEVDPGLIGGVRVTVGDEVLDASVRSRLDGMRHALTA